MEELLEEQMVKKMRDMERKANMGAESDSSSNGGVGAAERKKSRILAFFQRS